MSLITFTTDFGLQDWFVGVMKGVVLGISPASQVVDISHAVAPADLRSGAFVLAQAAPYFPPGTIHVVVVDPGVGSRRPAIVVRTTRYFWVGPDNGVLAPAIARDPGPVQVRRIQNTKFFLAAVSRTFHGRDVFAPVAAHLSRGVALADFGPEVTAFQQLPASGPIEKGWRWSGEVVYIDRFGNAITNLAEKQILSSRRRPIYVRIAGRRTAIPVCKFYQEVKAGRPLALLGSSGFLEIAVNGGNAAQALRLGVGTSVRIGP